MRLSQIDDGGSFALLGPGFAGEGFVLLGSLAEIAAEDGRARLYFAPYANPGVPPRALTGAEVRFHALELDVPPAQLSPRLAEDRFAEAVETIRERIAAGDVYQVNYTVRCALGVQSPAALVARLCARGVPRFLAWVRLPDGTELVSASPECFFAKEGRRIRVEPMKGTASLAQAHGLEASQKDHAELAMITDLMRNDLTPLCVPKSVRVLEARRLLRLPYAVTTVSDVEGLLREGVEVPEILSALHPGGSVTGAPKRAAMALIAALETTPRGPYCGALVLREGERATASLLIRTAFRDGEAWQYGVGGGITWLSTVEGEWAELHTKLGALR